MSNNDTLNPTTVCHPSKTKSEMLPESSGTQPHTVTENKFTTPSNLLLESSCLKHIVEYKKNHVQTQKFQNLTKLLRKDINLESHQMKAKADEIGEPEKKRARNREWEAVLVR